MPQYTGGLDMTMEMVRPDLKTSSSTVDKISAKYHSQPGAIITMLQEIQVYYGYIPSAAIVRLSQITAVPASDIYSIVTFYSQFRLSPRGENVIKICRGTACHLNEAEELAQAVYKYVGAGDNETSPDGKFTIEKVACLGCCSLSPAIMINGEVFGRLSPDTLPQVISEFLATRTVSSTGSFG
jgi:NADH:ubiquinone oxidoreductase subunit E